MVEQERRRAQRHRTLKGGLIAFNRAGTIECRVRNFSPLGACLETATPAGIPDEFVLLIERDNFKRRCRVIWRKPTQFGVEFIKTPVAKPAPPPQNSFKDMMRNR